VTRFKRLAGFRGRCALACLAAALVTAAPAAAREPAKGSVPGTAAALGHGSPAPAVRPEESARSPVERAAAQRRVSAGPRPLPGVDPVARWRPFVAEASRRFGVPAAWIERVIRAESGGRAVLGGRPVTSRAGAMGLMQLMPRTWAEMRSAHGLGSDPYDPRDNILAGAAYLAWLYRRFGYPGLFGAYNAGPGRYAAWLSGRGALPDETRAYLAQVGASPALPHLFAIAGAAAAGSPPARPASAAASAGQASSAPSGAPAQAPVFLDRSRLFAVDLGVGTAAGSGDEAGAGPGTRPSAQLEGGLFTNIPSAALSASGDGRHIGQHDRCAFTTRSR